MPRFFKGPIPALKVLGLQATALHVFSLLPNGEPLLLSNKLLNAQTNYQAALAKTTAPDAVPALPEASVEPLNEIAKAFHFLNELPHDLVLHVINTMQQLAQQRIKLSAPLTVTVFEILCAHAPTKVVAAYLGGMKQDETPDAGASAQSVERPAEIHAVSQLSDYEMFSMLCRYGHMEPAVSIYESSTHELRIKMLADNHYLTFTSACSGGHIDIATWLYNKFHEYSQPNFGMSVVELSLIVETCPYILTASGCNAFISACKNGHTNVAQWLLRVANDEQRQAMLTAQGYLAFYSACENGHTQLAQWLFGLANEVQRQEMLTAYEYQAATLACENGHTVTAQWLFSLLNPAQRQSIFTLMDNLIFRICSNGHVDVVKWLFSIADEPQRQAMLTVQGYVAFRSACNKGDAALAQWLFSLANEAQRQDMLAAYECEAFASACGNGHRDLAEWLFSQGNGAQRQEMLTEDNYAAFRWACDGGHTDVAIWLLGLSDETQRQAMLELAPAGFERLENLVPLAGASNSMIP